MSKSKRSHKEYGHLRSGHGIVPLQRRVQVRRPAELVILCDISGSMERYARMLLHFVHALTGEGGRVHTFLFGTRVTNVTRQLRYPSSVSERAPA